MTPPSRRLTSGHLRRGMLVETILFDVNGTLTDTSMLGEAWGDPGLGEAIFDQAIMTAMTAALVGVSGQRFDDHLRAAMIAVTACHGLDPGPIAQALEDSRALPARPGAGEALELLCDGTVEVIALTNSGADAGRRTLQHAGLLDCFDAVLGVEEVDTFKPHPGVYAHALAETGADPGTTILIATHPWDLAGASASGIATGWVTHGRPVWPDVLSVPDHRASTLVELARLVLDRRGR